MILNSWCEPGASLHVFQLPLSDAVSYRWSYCLKGGKKLFQLEDFKKSLGQKVN